MVEAPVAIWVEFALVFNPKPGAAAALKPLTPTTPGGADMGESVSGKEGSVWRLPSGGAQTLVRGCGCRRCRQCQGGAGGEQGEEEQSSSSGSGTAPGHGSWPLTHALGQRRPRQRP